NTRQHPGDRSFRPCRGPRPAAQAWARGRGRRERCAHQAREGWLTMDALTRLYNVPKPVIAMLHLPALPGRPQHDRAAGLSAAVESVGRDLEALQAAGVDGLLFCNEADIPYQMKVGPEITAGMASVIGQLRSDLR